MIRAVFGCASRICAPSLNRTRGSRATWSRKRGSATGCAPTRTPPPRRARELRRAARAAPSGQRYDQLGRVAAPVDRNDERALAGLLRDIGLLARQYARHRDHEFAAEVAARVAGDGVGHLADQVAHGLVTEVVLLSFDPPHGH